MYMFTKPYTIFEVVSGNRGGERKMIPLREFDTFIESVLHMQGLGLKDVQGGELEKHWDRNPGALKVKEYSVIHAHEHGYLTTVAELSVSF